VDQLTWRKQLPGAAKIRRVLDNIVSSHCFIIMKTLLIIKISKNIEILGKSFWPVCYLILLTGQCWNQQPIKQSLITAAAKYTQVLEL